MYFTAGTGGGGTWVIRRSCHSETASLLELLELLFMPANIPESVSQTSMHEAKLKHLC